MHSIVTILNGEGRPLVGQPRTASDATRAERWAQATTRIFNLQVQPDWQRKYDLRVDTLFDLVNPGSYTVSVARQVWESPAAGNPVTVRTSEMAEKNGLPVLRSGTALIRISKEVSPTNSEASVAPRGGPNLPGTGEAIAKVGAPQSLQRGNGPELIEPRGLRRSAKQGFAIASRNFTKWGRCNSSSGGKSQF